MLKELKAVLADHIAKQEINGPALKNFSIASSVYHSEERFLRECEALKSFPRFLGPKENFLIDNFHNACPHRGAKLKRTEDGYQCTYHGWIFDEQGSLRSTPGPKCHYRPGALGLKNFSGQTIGPMLFDKATLHPFQPEIETLSQGSSYLEERSDEVQCNWKFVVESLLETYHFPFVHNSLLGNFENAYFTHHQQKHFDARITVPLSNLVAAQATETLAGINIMYFLFPFTFILFMESGHICLSIEPLSPNRSQFKRTLFGEKTKKALDSLKFVDEILHQDIEVLEDQQINLSVFSRHYLTGYEVLIREFQERLNHLLTKL